MRTAGALENDLSGALLYRLGCGEQFPVYASTAAGVFSRNILRIRADAGYTDLLHYRRGTDAVAADGGRGAVSVYLPDMRQQAVYFADVTVRPWSTAFKDDDQAAGFSPAGIGAHYTAGLHAARLPGIAGSATLWGRYGRADAADAVTIRSFPHDDAQPELNLFLYDLLEQTFGRRIDAVYSSDGKTVGGAWRRNGWFADLAGTLRDGSVECRYTSTEPLYLAGDKVTDITLTGSSFALRGGKRFRTGPAALTVEPYYAYRSDSAAIVPRNPTPDSAGGYYDLTGLGGGALTEKSGGCRLRAAYASGRTVWTFMTGFGNAAYDGQGRIRTPVLGFVPVAVTHEFLAGVNATARSQEYAVDWSYDGSGNMDAGAGIRYTYSAIDITVNGRAGAVFNIVTTPVNETYRYRADVFALHAETAYAFTPGFTADVRLVQLVPLFSARKGGESGASVPSAGTGKKVEKFIRGGTEISIIGTWCFKR